MSKVIHFFIGTEAELMKLFPVINAAKARGYHFTLIASGQNNCNISPFLSLVGRTEIDLDLCEKLPAKSIFRYLLWLCRTAVRGVGKVKQFVASMHEDQHLMIVHGDTLSTVMGSWIARKCKLPYVHIESGLRSHNFFSPFPEEFDRLYGSRHSVINFCPKQEYADYAATHFRGKAVNTLYNTGIETLLYFINQNAGAQHSHMLPDTYFLFVLHRQENLLSRKFIVNTVQHVAKLSERVHCVHIYHQQTKDAMEKFGVYQLLENSPNVTMLPRQGYGDFIKLVEYSKFVVGDGCGNQQEFYYMGKPYLIMRTAVEESSEGLGHNAMPYGGDFSNIDKFYDLYKEYTKPPVLPEKLPSIIIMDELDTYFAGNEVSEKP